jgi:hypothetical protein
VRVVHPEGGAQGGGEGVRTIWKYALAITDEQTVTMPQDAEYLHVGMQNNVLYLWARVDPASPVEHVPIRVAGTGHPVEGEWDHLGTVHDRQFIWHVFAA